MLRSLKVGVSLGAMCAAYVCSFVLYITCRPDTKVTLTCHLCDCMLYGVVEGKVEAAYETFGGRDGAPKAPLRFNPVYDDRTEAMQQRVQDEAHAPFDAQGNHATST